MKMYEELIKDLRENHDKYFARDMEAADAIEELSKRVPPVPHGRLIDADAEVGVNVTMMPGGKCRVDLIAPTIIPASEEGAAHAGI